MTDQINTNTPVAVPGEVLIERTIQFRNSTFGGLKAFIRAHERRTGQKLTNAAAVDLLLRRELARCIHPEAVREMTRLSRTSGIDALHDAPDDAREEGVEPQEDRKKIGLTPKVRRPAAPSKPIIDVDIRAMRAARMTHAD
jgi:hypothetical protein